jgi:hypothetical protein
VTERRQFEQALARARDAAESASRAKSAFLANTSHELRTPLNGMIGLARMARAPDIGEDRRRQYLDQIAESAQALAGVISDILDLSKIEAGKLQLETTTFDLGELLRRLQQSYTTLAAAHGLRLQVEVDPSVQGMVSGDPLRVRQIISNYLNNALKFTAQGQISLLARREPDGDRCAWRCATPVPASTPPPRAAVRALHAGRSIHHPALRRHRPGPVHLPPARQPDGWQRGRAQRSRRRQHLLGRVAAAARSEAAGQPPGLGDGAGPRRKPAARCTRADGGRQPGEHADRGGHARTLGRAGDPGPGRQRSGGRGAGGRRRRAALRCRADGRADAGDERPRGHACPARLAAGPHLPIIALTAAALVSERDEALAAGMNDFLTKPIDADRLLASLLRWRGALQPG